MRNELLSRNWPKFITINSIWHDTGPLVPPLCFYVFGHTKRRFANKQMAAYLREL